MKKWNIIKPYLFIWLILEVIAVVIYIFAARDRWVFPILVNVVLIPMFIMMLSELFKKCPICGKRHLLNQIRCGGSRYTIYDAYCPVHKRWMDIEYDRWTGKYIYIKKERDMKWGESSIITPIWEQEDKEQFEWVFRNIQYLELEKEHWTARDLAERSGCSVRYARKVMKELNI